MIKVTICIGSSCHLKGSRQVVEELQYLIEKNNLKDEVELSGAFCMNKCSSKGVNISVDDEQYAIEVDKVSDFFSEVIAKKVSK